MKNYGTKTEFIIGLIGVIMHSFVVMFIVAFLASPGSLETFLETTTGAEREMLLRFMGEVESLDYMVYVGSAIIVFEWMAIFRILKYADRMTPYWAWFLILGALYAYFYFGGIEVFVTLLFSGVLTLVKYYHHKRR